MKKVRTVTAAYLKAQIEAGAQAVQLFDSWVGALSPEDYRAKVLPHSAWCLKEVSKLGVPVIHFGTQTAGFLEDFAGAGGDVVGVDWRIDLASARRRIGRAQAIQGNLDPVMLFAPRPALKAAVRGILKQDGRRGFIFNLGHGILPKTPVDNVRAAIDWVHEYSGRH
jgi:uroporphyrinogen decarboxylase